MSQRWTDCGCHKHSTLAIQCGWDRAHRQGCAEVEHPLTKLETWTASCGGTELQGTALALSVNFEQPLLSREGCMDTSMPSSAFPVPGPAGNRSKPGWDPPGPCPRKESQFPQRMVGTQGQWDTLQTSAVSKQCFLAVQVWSGVQWRWSCCSPPKDQNFFPRPKENLSPAWVHLALLLAYLQSPGRGSLHTHNLLNIS